MNYNSYNFIESKNYSLGFKFDGLFPLPPKEYLSDTSSSSESQTNSMTSSQQNTSEFFLAPLNTAQQCPGLQVLEIAEVDTPKISTIKINVNMLPSFIASAKKNQVIIMTDMFNSSYLNYLIHRDSLEAPKRTYLRKNSQ